jgi:hypothetical protein
LSAIASERGSSIKEAGSRGSKAPPALLIINTRVEMKTRAAREGPDIRSGKIRRQAQPRSALIFEMDMRNASANASAKAKAKATDNARVCMHAKGSLFRRTKAITLVRLRFFLIQNVTK